MEEDLIREKRKRNMEVEVLQQNISEIDININLATKKMIKRNSQENKGNFLSRIFK